MTVRPLAAFGTITLLLAAAPAHAQDTAPAQSESLPEIRQLVTFRFLPGKTGEALAIYREQAIPLYEANEPMLSFRGFREVESPEPLDLIVVSAFHGMAGMDASNAALFAEAERTGTSIGAIYGGISALTSGHHDQFVEMLPELDNGDPSSRRLVALVSYQLLPGEGRAYEQILKMSVVPWEQSAGVPSETGRFLVSDGWHYLRFIGFESLGDYHDYWMQLLATPRLAATEKITVRRKEIIVAPMRALSVR